mmetsp:Transcript_13830/g.37378  ORF Transcript_13830/g.37378 Transcript_13830/m.37378 type:complete len:229 (+) Transcript_13830:1449-2135(+)
MLGPGPQPPVECAWHAWACCSPTAQSSSRSGWLAQSWTACSRPRCCGAAPPRGAEKSRHAAQGHHSAWAPSGVRPWHPSPPAWPPGSCSWAQRPPPSLSWPEPSAAGRSGRQASRQQLPLQPSPAHSQQSPAPAQSASPPGQPASPQCSHPLRLAHAVWSRAAARPAPAHWSKWGLAQGPLAVRPHPACPPACSPVLCAWLSRTLDRGSAQWRAYLQPTGLGPATPPD